MTAIIVITTILLSVYLLLFFSAWMHNLHSDTQVFSGDTSWSQHRKNILNGVGVYLLKERDDHRASDIKDQEKGTALIKLGSSLGFTFLNMFSSKQGRMVRDLKRTARQGTGKVQEVR